RRPRVRACHSACRAPTKSPGRSPRMTRRLLSTKKLRVVRHRLAAAAVQAVQAVAAVQVVAVEWAAVAAPVDLLLPRYTNSTAAKRRWRWDRRRRRSRRLGPVMPSSYRGRAPLPLKTVVNVPAVRIANYHCQATAKC